MRFRQSLPRLALPEATPVQLKPHPSAEEPAEGRPYRADRATRRESSLESEAALVHSFKENLCHHPFVFMIKKMAVKDGHAPDHGIGEVHNDVDGTAVWDIHGV